MIEAGRAYFPRCYSPTKTLMNAPQPNSPAPPLPHPLTLLLIAGGAVLYAALVAGMIAAIMARFVAILIGLLW